MKDTMHLDLMSNIPPSYFAVGSPVLCGFCHPYPRAVGLFLRLRAMWGAAVSCYPDIHTSSSLTKGLSIVN